MKKIVLFLIGVFLEFGTLAQSKTDTSNIVIDNNVVYKLFPTQNMWTFIKLNTQDGRMWQVQFSVETNGMRIETFLNLSPLAMGNDKINGRFTLYSTENFYTFLLLDQINGRVWQVQWSQNFEDRFIVEI